MNNLTETERGIWQLVMMKCGMKISRDINDEPVYDFSAFDMAQFKARGLEYYNQVRGVLECTDGASD